MTAFHKVGRLAFDLLSIGVNLSDIRDMNVRQLNYWAELKRENDAVKREQVQEIERQREAVRNGRGKRT